MTMKIQNTFIALVMSVLLSSTAIAHSGHGARGPITQERAEARVESVIQRLVDRNKLESSWQQAQRQSVLQKETAQGRVWMIQYDNPTVSDPKNRSLYIVLDEMGNTLSASHSAPE